jgi:glyoxalase family protein
MAPHIEGIHHITAIAGDPQRTLEFYTAVLGLRLVKLTVNFDDPGTYHFYFGNETGAPGSILTFFPWPHAPRGTVGNGQVTAIAFSIPAGSLPYWQQRLREHRIASDEPHLRFDERAIAFTDPDGLPLELVAGNDSDPKLGRTSGSVPREHAVRGFHGATLSHAGNRPTAGLLEHMGLELAAEEDDRFRFAVPDSRAAIVDLVRTPDARQGRLGVGTVHHIAFRTPDDEQQRAWHEDLMRRGHTVTPIVDRQYFHSIYYREPGGVLFEIATNPPGFAIDEPVERLGERLMLPPWLEPERSRLARELPALTRTDLRPASV